MENTSSTAKSSTSRKKYHHHHNITTLLASPRIQSPQHKYHYFVKSRIPLTLRRASSTYGLHRISINKASTTHIRYHRQDCNLSQKPTSKSKSMRCYNISLPTGLLRLLLLLLNVLLCAEVLRCIAVTLKKLSTLLVALRLDSRSAPNALYVSLSLQKRSKF